MLKKERARLWDKAEKELRTELGELRELGTEKKSGQRSSLDVLSTKRDLDELWKQRKKERDKMDVEIKEDLTC